jgi:glycosidase
MTYKIKNLLCRLYGNKTGNATYNKLAVLLADFVKTHTRTEGESSAIFPLDEKDSILITYGDQFRSDNTKPLLTLKMFLDHYVKDVISGVHILPFSPYSSDDGFSVIDYRQVNPDFGTWEQIKAIANDYKLMCDLVLNHISSQSAWFKGFLAGSQKYRNYFITIEQNLDLSLVARPRALPLLHSYETKWGKVRVWTTFSRDQIDLNYKNPDLLLEMIAILLFYIGMGVKIIRLDAIAYLWKEVGTSCIHLPQTHWVVQLFRAIVNTVAPEVIIITETNVPHRENISYFGQADDEAHMVYQFSLPPLVLDAFRRQDAGYLTDWAGQLDPLSGKKSFFNFLASHDGVGLLPAHGILKPQEINDLVEHVKTQDGLVSYKATPQGDIPYELNISYFDAITNKTDTMEVKIKIFLASQAIMLAVVGVPGIYIHSLIGSKNYTEGVKQTGINRTINREKLFIEKVIAELNDNSTLRYGVYHGYLKLLKARAKYRAFHPLAGQEIIKAHKSLFILLRISTDGKQKILCIHSTSEKLVEIVLNAEKIGFPVNKKLFNIITEQELSQYGWQGNKLCLTVQPYAVLWLTALDYKS